MFLGYIWTSPEQVSVGEEGKKETPVYLFYIKTGSFVVAGTAVLLVYMHSLPQVNHHPTPLLLLPPSLQSLKCVMPVLHTPELWWIQANCVLVSNVQYKMNLWKDMFYNHTSWVCEQQVILHQISNISGPHLY